jgi:hypothetical protein
MMIHSMRRLVAPAVVGALAVLAAAPVSADWTVVGGIHACQAPSTTKNAVDVQVYSDMVPSEGSLMVTVVRGNKTLDWWSYGVRLDEASTPVGSVTVPTKQKAVVRYEFWSDMAEMVESGTVDVASLAVC